MVIEISNFNESRRNVVVELKAILRTEDFGSAGSRRLLKQGKMPAVVYGKSEPRHVIVNDKDFCLLLRKSLRGDKLVLILEGKEINCILKDYQDDYLTGVVKHADFLEV